MPKVWTRSGRLEQTLWKRVVREFCDTCGKSIKDDCFWVWEKVTLSQGRTLVERQMKTHLNMSCAGGAVLQLMEGIRAPVESTDSPI